MKLNLIVLRSKNMESLAEFYSALFGLKLMRHKHGRGPEHYGIELEGLIFEIYKNRNVEDHTSSTRLGFITENIENSLERVSEFSITVISEVQNSSWGKRMVFDDPEGHRIELTEKT